MKSNIVYLCSKCDAQFPKWSGRCLECGAWGTLKESSIQQTPKSAPKAYALSSAAPARVRGLNELGAESLERVSSDQFPAHMMFPEGLVIGSLTLLTGEPGAGKSTLCLQLAQNISHGSKVLYITSEESAAQIKERSMRIGKFSPTSSGSEALQGRTAGRQPRGLGTGFSIAESTNMEEIAATVAAHKPKVLCIDSLQTIVSSAIEADAGSINQIRTIVAMLRELAKQAKIAILLIGHVTKDGTVAGPKSLEHLVDAVYYLEADRHSAYRLLRSLKNRFGESGRVSVLQLGTTGLTAVANAATVFIQDYKPKPGSVITISKIDDQLFFLEIQALVTKSSFGYAKRTASGFPRSRLELLLAIMKKHLHIDCELYDVYVNVTGGFKITEPAMDFAVAMAVLSSLQDTSVPANAVIFGEIGLSGETRIVRDTAARLKEIEKHSFTSVFLPPLGRLVSSKLKLNQFTSLTEVVKHLGW